MLAVRTAPAVWSLTPERRWMQPAAAGTPGFLMWALWVHLTCRLRPTVDWPAVRCAQSHARTATCWTTRAVRPARAIRPRQTQEQGIPAPRTLARMASPAVRYAPFTAPTATRRMERGVRLARATLRRLTVADRMRAWQTLAATPSSAVLSVRSTAHTATSWTTMAVRPAPAIPRRSAWPSLARLARMAM